MIKKLKVLWEGITFIKLAGFLLAFFLLVFPFQIRTIFYSESVYWNGNFNTYDTFFIYFSDLILLGALICYGISYLTKESSLKVDYGDSIIFLLINALLLTMLLNTLFFTDSKFAILVIFRMLEMLILYLLITNEVLSREKILKYLIIGLLLQCGVAVAQYFMQKSVGLYALGEPLVGKDVLGVAKINFNGEKVVRAYGTFLHPNILAAALYMAIMGSIYLFRKKVLWFALAVFMLMPAFILTFSRTSLIAMGISLIIFFALSEDRSYYRYLVFIVCTFVFFIVLFDLKDIFWQRVFFIDDVQSSAERVQFANISKNMLMNQPWGVGMGNFTVLMQNYSVVKIFPWLMQPVHNVYLLMLNEAGVLGGSIFIALIAYIFFRMVYLVKHIRGNSGDKFFTYLMISILSGFIVEGFFDHYFLTSYQGLVLLFLFISLSSGVLKKFTWPLKKS